MYRVFFFIGCVWCWLEVRLLSLLILLYRPAIPLLKGTKAIVLERMTGGFASYWGGASQSITAMYHPATPLPERALYGYVLGGPLPDMISPHSIPSLVNPTVATTTLTASLV